MSFRHTGPEMRQSQFQTATSPFWCRHTTPAGWFQPVSCCVLPEICAPSLDPSVKEHRTSIASVPPTPHHHHLQTSSFPNAFSVSIPFSHSSLSTTHTHTPPESPGRLVSSNHHTSLSCFSSFISLNHTRRVWKTLVTRQKANCPWCTAKSGCVSEQCFCPCDSCNLAAEWGSA